MLESTAGRKPRISLIIPVYNTEKYLEACLTSVARQEESDFEALLIDDGSTDSSSEICDRFSGSDTRFKTFHIHNSGVSAARNYGLEKATGDFIVFVDSDDEVSERYLSVLMTNESSDLVIAGSSSERSDVFATDDVRSEITTYLLDDKGLSHLVSKRWINTIYAKRFRLELIREYQLRFHEEMSLGEDTIFVAEYLKHCRQFDYVSQSVYFYRYMDSGTGLSEYDRFYINKLEAANHQLVQILESIVPGVTESDYWKKRLWNMYYLAIIRILNDKGKDRQMKRELLNDVFNNRRFSESLEDIDLYMAGDGAILKGLIRKQKTDLLMMWWRYYKYKQRREQDNGVFR